MSIGTDSHNDQLAAGGAIRQVEHLRRFKKDSEQEDQQLLAKISRGDSAALSRIYDKYRRKIYSLVLQIVKREEDASEIVQDVFLQVWDKANLFDDSRGTFSAWLSTLAHNKAINVMRSRRFKKSTKEVAQDLNDLSELGMELTIERHTALDEQIELDERSQIMEVLNRIPSEQRTTLIMAYYSGYSQSEIAEALGVPLGTIKTRMRQGMIKLRELLDGRQLADI